MTVLALQPASADPLDEPAPALGVPDKALLLAIAQLGSDEVIAVGERGLVVRRAADGSWDQIPMPVRRALTAVASARDGRVIVVGHDALVLGSSDLNTWEVLWSEPELDAPFLDLWLGDDGRGFAVGAYGLALETRDAGRTWVRRDDIDPTESHLYAVREAAGGTLFIVGEFGTILRSRDRGATWVSLTADTDATFFGLRPGPSGRLLLYGLTGRLYESFDEGESWRRIDMVTSAPLYDTQFLEDGRVAIVGGNGTLLVESSGGVFNPVPVGHRGAVAAIHEMESGSALIVGERGARQIEIPGSQAR